MTFHKFSVLFVIVSTGLIATGCNCFNNSPKPTNPFAQNQQTVPPPGTFSSQEAFLGQTPGSYVPQTPATTFPSQATPSPASVVPSNVTAPNTVSDIGDKVTDKATVFSPPETQTGWTTVEVATTNQTAFQAMEAKAVTGNGSLGDAPESLVVGASHVVTTITDESTPLTEPAMLYSGKFAE